MTVTEIKAKLPEAEVYTLVDHARYFVALNRHQIRMQQLQDICQNGSLPQNTTFLLVDDPHDAIRILEVCE